MIKSNLHGTYILSQGPNDYQIKCKGIEKADKSNSYFYDSKKKKKGISGYPYSSSMKEDKN